MKIRSRKINDLDRGINHEIKSLPAITTIAMDSFKVSSELRLQPYKFSLE
ncbi:hypothetical protein [Rossellomorea aquimaris]|nr:hypothetical protein [Rossellomorea aquimaris]